MSGRDVVVTGIGLVTSLGATARATFDALMSGAPAVIDRESLPRPFHPAPALDLDTQIPRRGDQRQMEPWQRLGVFAAGLALDDAGLKGDAELLARTHMIVAAGGGERDVAVDEAIMRDVHAQANRDVLLNERLSNDLRPTLFLAQLSNLLAGNISIVHGVTGSSRTFMGEESAGVDALRTLSNRIRAGQIDLGLVGGAYSAARADMMLHFAFGDLLSDEADTPVWSRSRGMVTGTMGAFIVLEARAHAEARGKRGYATIASVASDRTDRSAGAVQAKLGALLSTIAPDGPLAVVSGATGIAGPTAEERAALDAAAGPRGLIVRATGTRFGHGIEPSAVANTAIAALAMAAGALPPPFDPSEAPATAAPRRIVVTSVGHWRGEGLVVVEAA